jgi:hypothetical protein
MAGGCSDCGGCCRGPSEEGLGSRFLAMAGGLVCADFDLLKTSVPSALWAVPRLFQATTPTPTASTHGTGIIRGRESSRHFGRRPRLRRHHPRLQPPRPRRNAHEGRCIASNQSVSLPCPLLTARRSPSDRYSNSRRLRRPGSHQLDPPQRISRRPNRR